MPSLSPREFEYVRGPATLIVGIDTNGRIYSKISKDGNVVARDIFVRFPSEVQLGEQGWIRVKHG